MPHELAERNIRLMASEVLPHLQGIWDDEGWENRWWPPNASRSVGVASQSDATPRPGAAR
jgi:hypothetical protein